MSKRQLAYWSGFGAITLLLVGGLLTIYSLWVAIPAEARPGAVGVVVFITFTLALPALAAAFFLWVGRKYPELGGVFEITLGSTGLFFGFLGVVALIEVQVADLDKDFLNVWWLPLVILGGGALLLASGLLLRAVSKELSSPLNSSAGV
jgi:hypothetical protein